MRRESLDITLNRRAAIKSVILGIGLASVPAIPAIADPIHPVLDGFEELEIASEMGPVKVQVRWSKSGGDAALYMLDGMRARSDYNGWSIETDALKCFADDNITLVLPVGGSGSWYSDWYRPTSMLGTTVNYKWETFLTRQLPQALFDRGISPTRTGVLGLSMGGTSALNLAAHHRDQFQVAASLSGYPHITAPGMAEAIRFANLTAGLLDPSAMYGSLDDDAWRRNDPYHQADMLRGLPMYLSAASGIPGGEDSVKQFSDLPDVSGGMSLEALSLINTKLFQARLADLDIPARFSYPAIGIHSWRYWSEELVKVRPFILENLKV